MGACNCKSTDEKEPVAETGKGSVVATSGGGKTATGGKATPPKGVTSIFEVGMQRAAKALEAAKNAVIVAAHSSGLVQFCPEFIHFPRPPAPPPPETREDDDASEAAGQTKLRAEAAASAEARRAAKEAADQHAAAARANRTRDDGARFRKRAALEHAQQSEEAGRALAVDAEAAAFAEIVADERGKREAAAAVAEAAPAQRAEALRRVLAAAVDGLQRREAEARAEAQRQAFAAVRAAAVARDSGAAALRARARQEDEQARQREEQRKRAETERRRRERAEAAAERAREVAEAEQRVAAAEAAKAEARLAAEAAAAAARKAEAAAEAEAKRQQQAEGVANAAEAAKAAAEAERVKAEAEAARLKAEKEASEKENKAAELGRKLTTLQANADKGKEKKNNNADSKTDPNDSTFGTMVLDSDDVDVEIPAEPTLRGTDTSVLFKDRDCRRIEDAVSKRWAFFNGTKEFELAVDWKFGPTSNVTALGTATLSKQADGWFQCKDIIYPGETNLFVHGTVNGWKSSYTARAIGPEYKAMLAQRREKDIARETAAVAALQQSKKIAKGDTNAIVAACVASSTQFVDADFPPVEASIVGSGGANAGVPAVPFARPRWFLNKGLRPRLFKNAIESNDIGQGQLGDCWFLSAVAALAEFPERVEDAFRFPFEVETEEGKLRLQAEQAVGAYRVCLNKNGWWENLVVDDFLPAACAPLFARNREEHNELWVALLEKAYAKLHGSYAAIVAGNPAKALTDLTGFPAFNFSDQLTDAARRDALFDDVASFDERGYLMAISTPGSEVQATTKYADAGLVDGHAFSLIGCVRVGATAKHGALRLVKVRNPWGTAKEWTGEWSDESPLWKTHPDVADACSFAPAPDGSFWMKWEDVCEYFASGCACLVRRGWHDTRIRGEIANGVPSVVLELTVNAPVELCLMLSQQCNRQNPDYELKPLQIGVAQPKDGAGKANMYEWSTRCTADPLRPSTANPAMLIDREVSLFQRFTPSEKPYLIIAREFAKKTTFPVVFGVLSEFPVGNAFTIKMSKISSDCAVFKNMRSFEYAPLGPAVCDFQKNTDDTAPVTARASQILS